MCYISSHSPKLLFLLVFFIKRHQKKMKNSSRKISVEPEKIIAERVNGWAAMIGFIAAIGAYLTTGQIIPGLV
tara:strand:+ start:2167 stop:2385 length:219 start_codon:yes stop_codon:yes gene_type:complete